MLPETILFIAGICITNIVIILAIYYLVLTLKKIEDKPDLEKKVADLQDSMNNAFRMINNLHMREQNERINKIKTT